LSRISIVIPVLNEVDSLAGVYREIGVVAESCRIDAEIIFVDDGSNDGSWSVMSEIARDDSRVQCLRFRRNFGKAAAIQAGVEVATGDLIATMDADLQDDPAELPRLLDVLNSGFDVVSGWKQRRYDPWTK